MSTGALPLGQRQCGHGGKAYAADNRRNQESTRFPHSDLRDGALYAGARISRLVAAKRLAAGHASLGSWRGP